VRIEAAAGLGGDVEVVAGPLLLEAGQQALAVAVAIDVGGVEEVHAQVQRLVQRGHGGSVVGGAPGATNGPGTEGDGGDLPAGAAEFAVLHVFGS
jgi:hypothetical protein